MIKERTRSGGGHGYGRHDDGLGANSDIGARLRALYGSVQEEVIPDRFLDLLEKLDAVESKDSDGTR